MDQNTQPHTDIKRLCDLLKVTGKNYDIDKIQRAYEYAYKLHEGQYRVSGEMYISHPVAVAEIVAGLELDTDSICAALLHDTVEDCSDKTDLEEIRKVDPSLKSLDDLGEGYIEYVKAGLPPVRAYWAVKAERDANRVTPPKEIGRVETGTAEKDYYTDAEIDAMSSEELTKNWKKVMASWDRRR